MVRQLATGAALLTFLASSGAACAFGALAIEDNKGPGFGYSFDQRSTKTARARALAACGSKCRVVATFRNTCAAYATDQAEAGTAFGWAETIGRQRAWDLAIRYCRNSGGEQCGVRVWACEATSGPVERGRRAHWTAGGGTAGSGGGPVATPGSGGASASSPSDRQGKSGGGGRR